MFLLGRFPLLGYFCEFLHARDSVYPARRDAWAYAHWLIPVSLKPIIRQVEGQSNKVPKSSKNSPKPIVYQETDTVNQESNPSHYCVTEGCSESYHKKGDADF